MHPHGLYKLLIFDWIVWFCYMRSFGILLLKTKWLILDTETDVLASFLFYHRVNLAPALTSSQTERCCRLAFGWRTQTPLCHRCPSWNAKMKKKQSGERHVWGGTDMSNEFSLWMRPSHLLHKDGVMNHPFLLQRHHKALHITRPHVTVQEICLRTRRARQVPCVARQAHAHSVRSVLYLSHKSPFQAFVAVGPDPTVAANGAWLVHEGRHSLADHLHQFAVRQTLIGSAHVHLWAHRWVGEESSDRRIQHNGVSPVIQGTPSKAYSCYPEN